MKKLIVLGLLAAIVCVGAWVEPTRTVVGWLKGDRFFEGRSTTFWHEALSIDDPALQEANYKKLLDDAAAVDVLRQLLGASSKSEIRFTAAEILGKKKEQARAAAAELIAALDDADEHVVSVAAAAIPDVGVPADQAVPALTKRLKTLPVVPVTRALSKYGAEARPALDDLVAVLRNEKLTVEQRWNAARTLGKMREAGAPAIPVLVEMLKAESSLIREHAAESLGDIGAPSRGVVKELLAVFTDENVKVRRDGVRSLGQIGVDDADREAAIAAAEKLTSDPEAIVVEAAKKTLELLKGQ